jgi:predicted alpha/beta-hydrolase family hydrolase
MLSWLEHAGNLTMSDRTPKSSAMSRSETFDWEGTGLSVAWDHPGKGGTYVLLGHGAGGNLHTPGLAAYARALAAAGVGAVRFNFPYAEAGRRVPDRQPTLERSYAAIAAHVRPQVSRLYLGGRSMGGRIASHVVASGGAAAGLVFLSYPLHPPGRPDRLRAAHLPKIDVPMLFLHGTRDAFADPALLRHVLDGLPAATLHDVEGADHGLMVRGRPAAEVIGELVDVTVRWIEAQRAPA